MSNTFLDLEILTRDELKRLYFDELLTDTEIADMYGTYQVKISRLRNKWDIETLDKTGRIERQLPELTDKQRELIIGSLMGDGWMTTGSSSETARFCETHSDDQKGYIQWKYNVLEPFSSSMCETEKRTEDKTYYGWSMGTRTCTALREFYDLFYPKPDRKRKFPAKLPELAARFSLAIWYLDDGSLKSSYHPTITFGLDKDSLFISLSVLRKFGLLPEVRSNDDGTQTIHFPGQSHEFFDLINEYVPECMAYKLPENSKRRQQDRNARKLTAETARFLSDQGQTYSQIADAFGVSVSTVRRRIKNGNPQQMGRLKDSHSVLSAHVALENLDVPDDWSNLSTEVQQKWIDNTYRILSKTPFPFPDKPTQYEAILKFNRLQEKEVFVTDSLEIRPRTLYGLRLCEGFFPHRFKAKYRDQPSCFESWFDDDKLKSAIRMQLRAGDPLVPYRVRKALQFKVRTPTNFRPGVSKAVCERYLSEGQTVYDPCIGYGGRLLGALASGVKYIGTDVSESSVSGAQELVDYLGLEDQVELYHHPAETFEIPRKVNMVFTSPPYFDREKYSNNADQSFMKYGSSVQTWLGGFLKPIIENAYQNLQQGGYLALNILDLKTRSGRQVIPLVDETKKLADDVGFKEHETLKMPLPAISSRDHEPILIFVK